MRKQLIIDDMSNKLHLTDDTDAMKLRGDLAQAAVTGEVVTVGIVNEHSLFDSMALHLRPARWKWWILAEVDDPHRPE